MMPVSSRRDGDSILVDGVDLKRAARNLRTLTLAANWQPPKDLSQALEMMARAIGYPDLHAVTAESARSSTAIASGFGTRYRTEEEHSAIGAASEPSVSPHHQGGAASVAPPSGMGRALVSASRFARDAAAAAEVALLELEDADIRREAQTLAEALGGTLADLSKYAAPAEDARRLAAIDFGVATPLVLLCPPDRPWVLEAIRLRQQRGNPTCLCVHEVDGFEGLGTGWRDRLDDWGVPYSVATTRDLAPLSRPGHMVRARESGDTRDRSADAFLIQQVRPQAASAVASNLAEAMQQQALHSSLRARFMPLVVRCRNTREFVGIVGDVGTGKATFAREMAEEFGAPVVSGMHEWPANYADGSHPSVVFFEDIVGPEARKRVAAFARSHRDIVCVVLVDTCDDLAEVAAALDPSDTAMAQALSIVSLEVLRAPVAKFRGVKNALLGFGQEGLSSPGRARRGRRP